MYRLRGNRFPTEIRPGGYQAWRDETPIRKPNAKAIFTIFGLLFFGCSACAFTIGVMASSRGADEAPQPIVLETLMPTYTATLTETPTETYTPTETPTETSTADPTATATDDATPTASATITDTPSPSSTPRPAEMTLTAYQTPTPQPQRIIVTAPPQQIQVVVTRQVDRPVVREVQIIVTAPPVIVTATHMPTEKPSETPTPLPTATIPPTATATMATPTNTATATATPTALSPETTQEIGG